MADVTLTYKGSDILELSNSGSATLKTGGTYCEGDIELEYVKPSGGGIESLLPTKDILSIEEYVHAEDWTTDALGNALNFAQTYMDYGNTTDFVIAYVYNNTASSYQASCLMFWAANSARTFTNNNAAGTVGSGSSFHITAGSLVRVIHLTSNKKSQTEESS